MRNTFTRSIQFTRFFRNKLSSCRSPAAMASLDLPPILEPTPEPPPLFDGTIRLYVNYECPFCQRVWIFRNIKVPALEHNGKVTGESLDLIKYIDSTFEGPSLVPNDHNKQNFTEEMMSYLDTLLKKVFTSFRGNLPAEDAGGEFAYWKSFLESLMMDHSFLVNSVRWMLLLFHLLKDFISFYLTCGTMI